LFGCAITPVAPSPHADGLGICHATRCLDMRRPAQPQCRALFSLPFSRPEVLNANRVVPIAFRAVNNSVI